MKIIYELQTDLNSPKRYEEMEDILASPLLLCPNDLSSVKRLKLIMPHQSKCSATFSQYQGFDIPCLPPFSVPIHKTLDAIGSPSSRSYFMNKLLVPFPLKLFNSGHLFPVFFLPWVYLWFRFLFATPSILSNTLTQYVELESSRFNDSIFQTFVYFWKY